MKSDLFLAATYNEKESKIFFIGIWLFTEEADSYIGFLRT